MSSKVQIITQQAIDWYLLFAITLNWPFPTILKSRYKMTRKTFKIQRLRRVFTIKEALHSSNMHSLLPLFEQLLKIVVSSGQLDLRFHKTTWLCRGPRNRVHLLSEAIQRQKSVTKKLTPCQHRNLRGAQSNFQAKLCRGAAKEHFWYFDSKTFGKRVNNRISCLTKNTL